MGIFFGKEKKQLKQQSRVTEQDRAVLQLKQQRDKIKQYQKKIVQSMEKDRLLAKQLLQQNKKERAKLLLKKKRFQEGLLQKTDNQLDNLEKMVHDIEFAQIEIKVVEGLSKGNEALKTLNAVFSVEDIENILDETQEAVEKQREIDALLSGQHLTSEDEEAIEAELNDIISQELPDVPAQEKEEEEDIVLPSVPDQEPEREKKVKKQAEMLPA